MFGTRKTVSAKNLFKNLPFENISDSSLFSSDSSTSSDSPNQLEANLDIMTDSSTAPTISDLTIPFSGNINLKDKVGLSLFVKATVGLPKEQKKYFFQETACKIVKAVEQANQAFFWGHICFKI